MDSFGRIFRLHIFGESHGPAVGVVIEGCPPGVMISREDFIGDLDRRRAGVYGTTPRREGDQPQIKSGLWQGKTTGTPVLILFENNDNKSIDYHENRYIPRPGHADWTGWKKYGDHNDHRGGGHFSGRLTVGLVAAGVIAKKILPAVEIGAAIEEIGGQKEYQEILRTAIAEGDSLGGIISCRAKGVPAGLGEPFFDGLESLISHVLLSIPGIKGIEFGAGFSSAGMKGSQSNDPILSIDGKTGSNNSGGINGGISNGNDLYLKVAAKPTPSISKEQNTIDLKSGHPVKIHIKGRHDACFALRLPVVIEAAVAIVLADGMLMSQADKAVIN
jgi:chorismate synthase